jgi:membrane associated rhomboid family serine protease
MFLPIGDERGQRRLTPYVNYALILANIAVFVLLQKVGSDLKFTYSYATVPLEIATGRDLITASKVVQDPITGDLFRIPGLQATPIPVWGTLVTSMFMHGGLAHLFGNMLFLWVFGDDIEDHLGHLRYLAFYLACGVLAALAHVAATFMFAQSPMTPCLGASGAISAVLGAYLLLHPFRRVRVLIGFFPVAVPALVAIGVWFVFQVLSGIGALGSGAQEGGVAYAAHVGGFLAGIALVRLFAVRRADAAPRPPVLRPSAPSFPF